MSTTRNGKIARLPKAVRDELGRRLQDGEQGKTLVTWLNSREDVVAVLREQFGGRAVTEQNLSEWKQGGYGDWQRHQNALESTKATAEKAAELATACGGRLSDQLALLLTAKYVVLIEEIAGQTADRLDPKNIVLLRDLCADVVALRRGDHCQARLNLEQEQIEIEREAARKMTEAGHWEWVQENGIQDQICQGYVPAPVRMERLSKSIWGQRPMENQNLEKNPDHNCPKEPEASHPSESDSIRADPTSFSKTV